MKKNTGIVLKIFLLLLVTVVVLHLLGFTSMLFNFIGKIQRNEINTDQLRLYGSIIVLTIILSSCFVASRMARKKNRSVILWISICLIINYWGILWLAWLPYKNSTQISHPTKHDFGNR
jgi:hypothetical protein